jgi:hypothetical protein
MATLAMVVSSTCIIVAVITAMVIPRRRAGDISTVAVMASGTGTTLI